MTSHKTMVETNTSVSEYEYEWKIKNFLKYYDAIRGLEFSPLKSIPLKLVFELEPRLERQDGHFDYKINMIKLSKQEVPKTCRFDIVVKMFNGSNSITALSTAGAARTVNGLSDSTHLFTGFLNFANNFFYINSAAIDANLDVTFLLSLTFFGHNISTISTTDLVLQLPNERYGNICRSLKTLYESKSNSDMSFKIGENTLQAHQCILVAQSPVFKRMFENNLSESKSRCIQIADFDAGVFDCFLKYLYCGDMEDTSSNTVMNLFALGDKYGVDGLVEDCGKILADNLSVESVCRIIILSYLHGTEELKNKSIKFINHHFSLIKKETDWAKLIDDYPKLASEIFSSMTEFSE